MRAARRRRLHARRRATGLAPRLAARDRDRPRRGRRPRGQRGARVPRHPVRGTAGRRAALAAACLRGKTANELVAALPFRRGLLLLPGVWWGPIVDGAELPRMPLAAIRAGDFARVPLILGTARDEGALHTAAYSEVSADELAWFVRGVFGEAAVAPVIARYARPAPKAALTDIVTDGIFRCNARRVARAAAGHGAPVYLYEWTHALDGPPRVHALGPTHGIDLFFLWGASLGIGPSAAEQPLADLVQDLWGSFVHTGDPGHGWPRYTAAGDAHFVLDLPPATGAQLDASACDFWDSLSRF